jgi:hypothetical protein
MAVEKIEVLTVSIASITALIGAWLGNYYGKRKVNAEVDSFMTTSAKQLVETSRELLSSVTISLNNALAENKLLKEENLFYKEKIILLESKIISLEKKINNIK